MKKLLPNTIEGLIWGLENFDGIETDLRLTQDGELLIYHDPVTTKGNILSKTNIGAIDTSIPRFSEFITNSDVIKNVSIGKYLWLELKPNCIGRKSISKEIAEKFYNVVINELDRSKIDKSKIRFLSFSKDLLDPFANEGKFRVYPILPSINECNRIFIKFNGFKEILSRSLNSHIDEALERNFKGLLFARQYLFGLLSKRHPTYEKMKEIISEKDIELGSNLGEIEFESEYPVFLRFSDKTHVYPRYGKEGEGQIIAHRGTGTKGVIIGP